MFLFIAPYKENAKFIQRVLWASFQFPTAVWRTQCPRKPKKVSSLYEYKNKEVRQKEPIETPKAP